MLPASNLWQATATEAVTTRPLAENVEADVAIVGGGYTGWSAALHLAEKGFAVCLLEAATIGHGGSGRNVGLVNAGLWLPPDDVESRLGREEGARLNAALGEGPAIVFALIDRHAIACDATRTGTLHCAHAASAVAGLRERLRQLEQRGAPVALLNASETVRLTGAHGLHGALRDPRAGTIQPLAYARGLARAAIAQAAHLHERSPVTAIERHGATWRVRTGHGSVRARALLVAVNAYATPDLASWSPEFMPLHYFQVATKPLAGEGARTILPERQGAWDTATVMSSFRRDRDVRLVIGGIGTLDGPGAAAHQAWAQRKLRALFPQLAAQPFEHAWFGRMALTADRIPKILRLDPGGYSMYGYSGRGIAPGTVMGRAFARYVTSGSEREFPVTPVQGYAYGATRILGRLYDAGAAAVHIFAGR